MLGHRKCCKIDISLMLNMSNVNILDIFYDFCSEILIIAIQVQCKGNSCETQSTHLT